MSPDQLQQKQSGAGLPIALFIITVLSLIVLSMSQLQESSGKSISLQIQSQRAFFAAESGAQVAIAEVFDGGICSGGELEFSAAGLQSCKARLSGCEAGDEISFGVEVFYRIKSEGICGEGTPDEASRTVEVTLRGD